MHNEDWNQFDVLCKACEGSFFSESVQESEYGYLPGERAKVCVICGKKLCPLHWIKITGPFIIIVPYNEDMKTKAGVILPHSTWRLWKLGKVVKVPEHNRYTCFKRNKKGKSIGKLRTFTRPEVEVGDLVMFEKYAARGIDLSDGFVYMVHFEDIPIKLSQEDAIIPM